ncbi:cell death abnormality protein 1-like [Saccostrea cucullata]|uniref:cell death abnormality protein 1-like n=1 Tax=Saccostrea cuccullata TaxID=36930 RepID=UPI002ED260DF
MGVIILILMFSVEYQIDATSSECSRPRGCCRGFRYDPNLEECIKCKIGYGGPACLYPCPYPGYGFGCQRTCKCTEGYCNVTVGCPLDCEIIPNCSTVIAGNKTSPRMQGWAPSTSCNCRRGLVLEYFCVKVLLTRSNNRKQGI